MMAYSTTLEPVPFKASAYNVSANIQAVLLAYLLLSTTNLILLRIIPVNMKYFVRYLPLLW
jgi:hypothetical protein